MLPHSGRPSGSTRSPVAAHQLQHTLCAPPLPHPARYYRALPEQLALLRAAVHEMRFPPDEVLERAARAHVAEAEEEVEARHALLVTQA